MRRLLRTSRIACLACALALGLAAGARADDRAAERAARHMQLQMQDLQRQLQQAQAAQAKAEADKADADKKLAGQAAEIPRAQGAARTAAAALKTSEAVRAEALARVAALEHELAESRRSGDAALAAKSAELDKLAATRNEQLAQLLGRYQDEMAQYGICADKNQRLVQVGAELLDRYRHKGFAQLVKQGDPFLGLGDVETFNVVQTYRDRLDAERLNPAATDESPHP